MKPTQTYMNSLNLHSPSTGKKQSAKCNFQFISDPTPPPPQYHLVAALAMYNKEDCDLVQVIYCTSFHRNGSFNIAASVVHKTGSINVCSIRKRGQTIKGNMIMPY